MAPLFNQSSPTAHPDLSGTHLPTWKRIIDIACCLLALPFLGGLALLMTIVTKLVAPGPVLFRQERVGCMGRRFWIYKFRTMYVGADTHGHQNYCKDLIHTNAPMAKLDAKGDSRLIPGSRLLRASGLDELPQIINVLRGDMSIVGPRPCILSEYETYLPWQRQRCMAMPGLTGLWQVSGKNRTTFEEMVRLDIRYGQSKTWWLDIKIILLTVPALLGQIADTRRAASASAAPAAKAPSGIPSYSSNRAA
jgi:lipopolysaccharide/colanic/teichoic acid biosynthesis glycosyltransferase